MAGAAFTASALSFAARAQNLGLPAAATLPSDDLREAVASLPNRGSSIAGLREAVASNRPLEINDPQAASQRFWGESVHLHHHEQLLARASARSLARLKELKGPNSGAWLTPPPAPALGLSFSPAEFKKLLKWRLGIQLLPQPIPCPRCAEMMDIYGDHAMTCARMSHVARHRYLVDALARVAALSGARIQREVAVAGRLRPADLLVSGWGPEALAIDVTIRHGVAQFDTCTVPLDRAATSKHAKYDVSCRDAKVDFQVFGMSTFGATSEETDDILRTLRSKMAECYGKREGRDLAQQAAERLGVATMRGVGAELLEMTYIQDEEALYSDQGRPTTSADAGYRGGKGYVCWATRHGFAPALSTGVPGSAGIRVLTSLPSRDPVPEILQRRLFWEDPAMGSRVWIRN